jgi:hypothetical protein
MKKLFFSFIDLVFTNAMISHKLCGGNMTQFGNSTLRDLVLLAYDQNITENGIACGRPSTAGTQLNRFSEIFNVL